ncbi:MAG: efflux RND transporter periplasmic adaptor subunit [FCB group bacterium]|jgi:HlyD family secretion protein|nr:efflux RND transporter periplasmic adaptor subunit [FCB group bacterium]
MTDVQLDEKLSKLRIDKKHKQPRRRRAWRSWAILVLIAAAVGALAYARMNAPISVKTTQIEKENVAPGQGPALVTASGYVVPRRKVEVSSKIVGRVVEATVARGDLVQSGDVLLKIEDADYVARVRSAEAAVAALRARVAELRAGSRPQEIAAANAAVASSEATLNNAELDLKRLEGLLRQGIVSSKDVDQARAARDVAQAKVNSDRSTAQLVQIGPRREVIEAAEAELRQAEAVLEVAKTELDYTIIRAPISGTILEKLAEEGELVTNANFGGTRGAKSSVVSMADLRDLQVEVDVNEVELSKIKPGQQAEIRLDSNPERVYAGQVDEISPQADRQKGSVQVKVRILDPDETMTTEVNARVTFLGDAVAVVEAKSRLWIPKSAAVEGDNGSVVYVLSEGKAVAKPVTLGTEGEKGVEVVEGLDGSETLITSPLDQIKDGARVVAEA